MKKNLTLLAAGVLMFGLAGVAGAATPLNAIFSADGGTDAENARVRVVHASPDAPAVDVWIDGSVAIGNLAFEEISDFLTAPAGTYQVQVVPTGATEPVVIEASLTLDAGTDYTVVATDTLENITPVILTNAEGSPSEGNAWVRFFHGSPDTSAVDITLPDGTVLFADVEFQEVTDYIAVPGGTYDLLARVADTPIPLLEAKVTVMNGGIYTAYAVGLEEDINNLDTFYFLPAAARGEGAQDSFFLSDVDVQNRSAGPANFQFLWLPRNADNSEPAASDTFSISPGEAVRFSDVLGEAFGVTDDVDAFGALALIANRSDLLLFSRIYNANELGTFGQGLPGFAADDLIPAGEKRRLLFFTENPDFRSNIGILNGTGAPMTIMWERYTADGTLVDAASAELPAWGNTQLNRVFAAEAPVVGGYIDVWTETEGAAFMAYGSVAGKDAFSDPTTVLPQ
jgi:hypothetical protein